MGWVPPPVITNTYLRLLDLDQFIATGKLTSLTRLGLQLFKVPMKQGCFFSLQSQPHITKSESVNGEDPVPD